MSFFSILGLDWVQMIIKILVALFLFALPLAAFLTYFERKWSALIQDRVGPNRANIGFLRLKGILHVFADIIKLVFKEDAVTQKTNRFLFSIAPFFSFIAAFAIFALIPIAAPIGDFSFQITDVNTGMLALFAFTSLGVYGPIFGGWSTDNKFGLLGSLRASAQMISYEVFLGLSLVGLFLVYDSLRISDIVAGQNQYWLDGWIPKWGLLTQPLAFFLFFIAMIAETKRAPFDAPEGESEIIGYFVEYSGTRFASFFLAEYVSVVGVACLMTTLFFGSYHLPWLFQDGFHFGSLFSISLPVWAVSILQIFSFFSKVLFFCWLQLMLRWSLPRFRFDQIMTLGWKKMLPLSLANVIITALIILVIN